MSEQCGAITQEGSRCSRLAVEGTTMCRQHSLAPEDRESRSPGDSEPVPTSPTELAPAAPVEQDKPLLAVVILAYNEEDVVARAIASCAAFGPGVPVIVSVDHKTTDNSHGIAEAAGAHVMQHMGIPDPREQQQPEPPGTKSVHAANSMARMRNDVLDAVQEICPAEYVLWLDADEFVAEGHLELLEALAFTHEPHLKPQGVMLRMVDVDPDGNSWRTWENVKVLAEGQRFQRRRHEGNFTARVRARLPEVHIHHAKTLNEEQCNIRLGQKLALDAYMADWNEFKDVRAAYYTGDCLLNMGQREQAILWFERAVSMEEPGGQAQRSLAAMKLAHAHANAGDLNSAHDITLDMIKFDWNRGDAFYDLAMIAGQAGHLDEAEQWLRHAIVAGPAASVQEMPTEKVEDLPHLRLGMLLAERGEFDEAYEQIELARAFGRNRPEFQTIRAQLLDAMAAQAESAPRNHDGLIVVSGGMRTGTTWMSDVFNRLGRFVNEPMLLAERGYYHSEESTAGGKDPQCSEEFAARCTALLPGMRPIRGRFTVEEQAALVDLYAEFVQQWEGALGFKDALPRISALAYPDSQLVILERRTESVLASISKRFKQGPDVSAIKRSDPAVWDALLPDGHANTTPMAQRRMEQAVYNEMLQWLDRQELEEFGDRVRFVDFEDVTANYQHVVPELLDWLGFDVDSAYDAVLPLLRAPVNRPAQSLEERKQFKALADEVRGKRFDTLGC